MGLDIRFPIGLMFSILGGMLVIFGLMSDASVYERSLGYNVNVWWGLVVLAFGLVMLVYGRLAMRNMPPVRPSDGLAPPDERRPLH